MVWALPHACSIALKHHSRRPPLAWVASGVLTPCSVQRMACCVHELATRQAPSPIRSTKTCTYIFRPFLKILNNFVHIKHQQEICRVAQLSTIRISTNNYLGTKAECVICRLDFVQHSSEYVLLFDLSAASCALIARGRKVQVRRSSNKIAKVAITHFQCRTEQFQFEINWTIQNVIS